VTQVFLNYRRADEPFGVAMLDRELSARFGDEAVFFASKSIQLGASWEEEMFAAVERSTALLVVMGRRWLDDTDDTGRRRLLDEKDFVRREILLAMELDKHIISVRLGTPRPSPSDLPSELRTLADRQDIELQFRTAGPDIDRLETKLRRLIPELATTAPKELPEPARTVTYRDHASHYEISGLVVDTFHAGPTFHLPNSPFGTDR
jgi:hypothetical protein